MSLSGQEVPLLVKVFYTVGVSVVVPVYWHAYGPRNFLWFSDLALLITVVALWLESPLLASMQAVAVVLLELLWSVILSADSSRAPTSKAGTLEASNGPLRDTDPTGCLDTLRDLTNTVIGVTHRDVAPDELPRGRARRYSCPPVAGR